MSTLDILFLIGVVGAVLFVILGLRARRRYFDERHSHKLMD